MLAARRRLRRPLLLGSAEIRLMQLRLSAHPIYRAEGENGAIEGFVPALEAPSFGSEAFFIILFGGLACLLNDTKVCRIGRLKGDDAR